VPVSSLSLVPFHAALELAVICCSLRARAPDANDLSDLVATLAGYFAYFPVQQVGVLTFPYLILE
jgi:hypothetical protein